jgi:hypothetical protein
MRTLTMWSVWVCVLALEPTTRTITPATSHGEHVHGVVTKVEGRKLWVHENGMYTRQRVAAPSTRNTKNQPKTGSQPKTGNQPTTGSQPTTENQPGQCEDQQLVDRVTELEMPPDADISVDFEPATLEQVRAGMIADAELPTNPLRKAFVIAHSPIESVTWASGDGKTLAATTHAGELIHRDVAPAAVVLAGDDDAKHLAMTDIRPGEMVMLIPKEGPVTKVVVFRGTRR